MTYKKEISTMVIHYHHSLKHSLYSYSYSFNFHIIVFVFTLANRTDVTAIAKTTISGSSCSSRQVCWLIS